MVSVTTISSCAMMMLVMVCALVPADAAAANTVAQTVSDGVSQFVMASGSSYTSCDIAHLPQDIAAVDIPPRASAANVTLQCNGQLTAALTKELLVASLQTISWQLAELVRSSSGGGSADPGQPPVNVTISISLGADVYKASTLNPTAQSDYVRIPVPRVWSSGATAPLATTSNATNASAWDISASLSPSGSLISASLNWTSNVSAGSGLWFATPRWRIDVAVVTLSQSIGNATVSTPVTVRTQVRDTQGDLITLPEAPTVAGRAGALHFIVRNPISNVSYPDGLTTLLPANTSVVDSSTPLQLVMLPSLIPLGLVGSTCGALIRIGNTASTENISTAAFSISSASAFPNVVDLGPVMVNPVKDYVSPFTVRQIQMECAAPVSVGVLLDAERQLRVTVLGTSGIPAALSDLVMWSASQGGNNTDVAQYVVLPPSPSPLLPPTDALHVDDDGDGDTILRVVDGAVQFPITIKLTSTQLPAAPPGATSFLNMTQILEDSQLAWAMFVLVVPLVMSQDQLVALGTRSALGTGGSGNAGYTMYLTTTVPGDNNHNSPTITTSSTILAANITLYGESSLCAFVQIVSTSSSLGAAPSSAHRRSEIACAVYTTSRAGVPLWVYQVVAAILGALLLVVVLDDAVHELRAARRHARSHHLEQLHAKRQQQLLLAGPGETYRGGNDAGAAEQGRTENIVTNNTTAEDEVIHSWDDGGLGMLTVMSSASPQSTTTQRHNGASARHRRRQVAPLAHALEQHQQRRQNDPFYEGAVLGPVDTPTVVQPSRPLTHYLASQRSGQELAAPSPMRRAYVRLCGCVSALWDVATFAVNIAFVVCTIGKHPHVLLAWIFVLIGVMFAALIALAIRAHVALFSMPSKMSVRTRQPATEVRVAPLVAPLRAREQRVGRAPLVQKRSQQLEGKFFDTVTHAGGSDEEPSRTAARDPASAQDDADGGESRWETSRLSQLPLASHFWPVVGLYVLAAEATWVELEFTVNPRLFWAGVQRWVHDMPSFAIGLWFAIVYSHYTNVASAVQLFVAGAGVAFSYRGVLTAAAVPALIAVSRCCARLRTTTLELWVRERTGLLTVAALASSPSSKRRNRQKVRSALGDDATLDLLSTTQLSVTNVGRSGNKPSQCSAPASTVAADATSQLIPSTPLISVGFGASTPNPPAACQKSNTTNLRTPLTLIEPPLDAAGQGEASVLKMGGSPGEVDEEGAYHDVVAGDAMCGGSEALLPLDAIRNSSSGVVATHHATSTMESNSGSHDLIL